MATRGQASGRRPLGAEWRRSRGDPLTAGGGRRGDAKSPQKKVGYAVIGLGHIAQVAVLPAFQHAKNSRLVALVSDDEEKRRKLSRKYRCEAYGYRDLDEALAREDVNAVYIALPN